jgi:dipeptidyl aminopeptidase/acylaminoacyl peptidase
MSLRPFRIPAPARRGIGLLLAALPLAAQPRPWTPSDLWEQREIRDVRIDPEGARVIYVERRADRESNAWVSRLWLAASGAAPRPLTPEGGVHTTPRWSPDASRIAFLSERSGESELSVLQLAGAAPTRLILPPGVTPLAFCWSPDGRTIAYTARTAEPQPGAAWAPPALLPQLRARHTRLYLIPAAGGESRAVPLGSLEPVGGPAWMPDGRSLLLSLAAPFDSAHPLEGPEIYSLRLPDFTLRRLTTHPGPDLDPVPSPDGSRIAWIARDATPQHYVTAKLWVANPDGSRARILAGALDRDPLQPAWSNDSRTVYFLALDRGESRVFAARNDGSVRTVLSAARLSHFTLADNGRAAAVRGDGELIGFPVDLPGTPTVLIPARSAASAEAFEYRSGPRAIQAWLLRPPDFDAARKYPLLLDIDDAPRRMCGPEFSLRGQVFAAAGFLVLCANARGAPGYGEAFTNLIRSGFPGDDYDDWMAGLDAVAARPYVDSTRLAIGGGISAAWAIGHTERFYAAIARRPLVDFTLDITTAPDGRSRVAAWMGAMPWADQEQYWKRSPLSASDRFRTPTLILAPEHDAAAQELHFALRAKNVETALIRLDPDRPADQVLEWEAQIAWLRR